MPSARRIRYEHCLGALLVSRSRDGNSIPGTNELRLYMWWEGNRRTQIPFSFVHCHSCARNPPADSWICPRPEVATCPPSLGRHQSATGFSLESAADDWAVAPRVVFGITCARVRVEKKSDFPERLSLKRALYILNSGDVSPVRACLSAAEGGRQVGLSLRLVRSNSRAPRSTRRFRWFTGRPFHATSSTCAPPYPGDAWSRHQRPENRDACPESSGGTALSGTP